MCLWSNKKCNIILLYLYLIKTWFWFAFPVLPATFYQRQVQINNHLTWRPPEKHFLPILHMLAWSPLRLFCWKYHWSNTSYSLWNLDVLFFHISLIMYDIVFVHVWTYLNIEHDVNKYEKQFLRSLMISSITFMSEKCDCLLR